MRVGKVFMSVLREVENVPALKKKKTSASPPSTADLITEEKNETPNWKET